MKKTRPNPRANKNILWFAYGVVGVFAAMGLYMGVFLQFQSEDDDNNPYNARIAGMADPGWSAESFWLTTERSSQRPWWERTGRRREAILTENCLPMWPVIPPWERQDWNPW